MLSTLSGVLEDDNSPTAAEKAAARDTADEPEEPPLPTPWEKLEHLEQTAATLELLDDAERLIEVRIREMAVCKMLVDAFQHPPTNMGLASCRLAEAYIRGGYPEQARHHLKDAQSVVSKLRSSLDRDRLMTELNGSTAYLLLIHEQNVSAATKKLSAAARLCVGVHGESNLYYAKLQVWLALAAIELKNWDTALDHLSAAWEIREDMLGLQHEGTVEVWLRMAETQWASGQKDDAIALIRRAVETLEESSPSSALLIESAFRLSEWMHAKGDTEEAMDLLESAAGIATEVLGHEHPNTIKGMRNLALLQCKADRHDLAFNSLKDVLELERHLFGELSVAVGRTLKALGTVCVVQRRFHDASEYYKASLRVFQCHPSHPDAIRDLRQKLRTLSRYAPRVPPSRGDTSPQDSQSTQTYPRQRKPTKPLGFAGAPWHEFEALAKEKRSPTRRRSAESLSPRSPRKEAPRRQESRVQFKHQVLEEEEEEQWEGGEQPGDDTGGEEVEAEGEEETWEFIKQRYQTLIDTCTEKDEDQSGTLSPELLKDAVDTAAGETLRMSQGTFERLCEETGEAEEERIDYKEFIKQCCHWKAEQMKTEGAK
ncbi:unnamed protein product [Vitrella brassicaformis CCMP3155]|uniref:EF-hand domain-containing protein n=2 Tax=Vitrella brassicaformis TaxID=1169539 RepID=A0A0G4FGU5_VITBC|nr:unnamed protein product [Vitrella brassicaformis CCMP3155]|eukprot:CEM12619.1 unnamed protein product [Vitrella brassicaformis CCMP3155]